MSDEVDALVVGGGAAGLAAATWLARYRRKVCVADSGDYRAYAVAWSHGYLGGDPQRPLELLDRARDQLLRYTTATYRRGVVAHARGQTGGFDVFFEDGSGVRAHRLVLATGVEDVFPDVDGFGEHYGASAFHCPACDGYDAEGRHVVAHGWDRRLVGFATSLLDWARSVTVVTSGRRFEGDGECRDLLARHGVEVVEEAAQRLLGRRGDMQGVLLAGGRVLPAELLFFSVAHRPRTDLARALGCRLDDDGHVWVDGEQRTSVAGVYAAGDVAPGLQLVQVAAAQGTVAGVAAALSLHGEGGSPASPPPAPDVDAELSEQT